MVALYSAPTADPPPRSPLTIAADVRRQLQTASPSRFSHVEVRVANGAVALTGSVPTYDAKSLALRTARSAFADLHVIDALEVQNRRSFHFAATSA